MAGPTASLPDSCIGPGSRVRSDASEVEGSGSYGAALTRRLVAWTYQSEGIRCNVVCPGGVATNIATTGYPKSAWGLERLARIHASGTRMAQPDEIATLISWLASDEASNVSGAVIAADSAWTAG